MRGLITMLTALSLALLLVQPAYSKDVPLHNAIPHFKKAPIQITCARSAPGTVVHTQIFINKGEGWRVNIFGRNGKDLSLSVLPTDGDTESSHFFLVNGVWKLRKDTTSAELAKLPVGDLYYSDEELTFLRECVKELMPK